MNYLQQVTTPMPHAMRSQIKDNQLCMYMYTTPPLEKYKQTIAHKQIHYDAHTLRSGNTDCTKMVSALSLNTHFTDSHAMGLKPHLPQELACKQLGVSIMLFTNIQASSATLSVNQRIHKQIQWEKRGDAYRYQHLAYLTTNSLAQLGHSYSEA